MKKREVRYYQSYTDDFVETKDQAYKIPEGYRWLRLDPVSRLLSGLIYTAAILFSSVYCRLVLHVRYRNARVLRQARKTGAFLFCNHTQPFGDVFIPALPALPARIYTVVSPANLGIPVIGKLLPYLGALPVPDTIQGMKRFQEAMEYRLGQRRYITVYPEAHVWEYYTGIRPFPDTSFKYPVKYGKPAYSLTVTYQKRRSGGRPRATVYIDGPFYPNPALPRKAQAAELRDTIFRRMTERSGLSNDEFSRYERAEAAPQPENGCCSPGK